MATSRPMIRAPELAMGAMVLNSSVIGEDAQEQECGQHDLVDKGVQSGVMARPGWVKNTPAAPPSPARVR